MPLFLPMQIVSFPMRCLIIYIFIAVTLDEGVLWAADTLKQRNVFHHPLKAKNVDFNLKLLLFNAISISACVF